MSSWLDNSNNANCFKSMYVKGFVDVSGSYISRDPDTGIILTGDASFNSRLSVAGDASFNDVYIKQNLIVDGDINVKSYNNEYIINTTTTDYTLIVAEDLSLNGRLLVNDDVSFNSKLYVAGTITGNITGNAGTVTNGVYTTSSATALSDITSVGSGAIITSDERTKLSGIETSADVTDATNVAAAGAVMTSGDQTIAGAKTFSSTITGDINGNAGTVTNGVYTTSSATALSDITSVGSGAIITSDERTKLSGIETSADVTDATNVAAAGAVMNTGNETIAGTKTFSSTITGDINGNAGTASKLAAAVDIGSASFDGSSSIEVQPKIQSTGAAPTGTATAGVMRFDITDAILYISTGSVWKKVALNDI